MAAGECRLGIGVAGVVTNLKEMITGGVLSSPSASIGNRSTLATLVIISARKKRKPRAHQFTFIEPLLVFLHKL